MLSAAAIALSAYLTGEALDQQIAESYARHQAEPENLDFVRKRLSVVVQDTYKGVPAPHKLENDLKLIAGLSYTF